MVVPDPLTNPDLYADAVVSACRDREVDLLLPVTEASLLALLPARDRLDGVAVPFPPADRFRTICDKDDVLRRAGGLGLSVPRQVAVECWEEVDSRTLSDVPVPVVLKPARSVAEEDGRRIRLGVRYARDHGALRRKLKSLPAGAFPILLQQRIVGPGVGIFLLLWEGRLIAAFAHRRIREKPPSGGVSVYRESIPLDPELLALSRRLLDGFGWEGVAMVEYKVDQSTGTPYLMEVNGRFWGSLQLAIDAGVDFPALLAACALGDAPAEPVTSYRIGVRSRWWWGDVDHLLLRLRRSAEELALPSDAPGRWRALRDFLVLWRPGDRSEVLRISDPMPFLQESADWFRAAFRTDPLGADSRGRSS